LLVMSIEAAGAPVATTPLAPTLLRSFWEMVSVAPLLTASWPEKLMFWSESVDPELNVRLSQAKVLFTWSPLAVNCPPKLTWMRVVSLPLPPERRKETLLAFMVPLTTTPDVRLELPSTIDSTALGAMLKAPESVIVTPGWIWRGTLAATLNVVPGWIVK